MKIYANTRTTDSSTMTGIKRYTEEILGRTTNIQRIQVPVYFQTGVTGRLWEQTYLPLKIEGLLWSPANIGPAFLRRHVVTIHDLATIEHPEWFTPRFSRMFRTILPLLTKNSQHIITVSEYSRQKIIQWYNVSPNKITAIPLAADERFKPLSSQEKYNFKLDNDLPENFLLYVGGLEPRKNLARLFAAWESWTNRPKDLKLMIIGVKDNIFSGAGYDKVPKDVIFVGHVSDDILPQYYAAANIFIYPSIYEGFGLPPLEAMACGTPVITSNTTSLPEVVSDAALKFDPLKIEEIRQSMEMLTSNPDRALDIGSKGLERSKTFSWATTTQETLNLLAQEAER